MRRAAAAPAAPAPGAAAGAGAGAAGRQRVRQPATSGAGAGGGGAAAPRARRCGSTTTAPITGLAARAADDFRSAGWTVDEVGQLPAGIIPTTTVYYRPGTERAGRRASALGSEFGLRVAPRFAGLQDASPGLIVIVTNDYQQR